MFQWNPKFVLQKNQWPLSNLQIDKQKLVCLLSDLDVTGTQIGANVQKL
jgi:hypothetical protein